MKLWDCFELANLFEIFILSIWALETYLYFIYLSFGNFPYTWYLFEIFVIFHSILEFYFVGWFIRPFFFLLTLFCFWFMLVWSEELSHMLYAAADMVFVPSMYEPCGLAQMIGMRYGAVCISIGWLSPTVKFIAHLGITNIYYSFWQLYDCNLSRSSYRGIALWF